MDISRVNKKWNEREIKFITKNRGRLSAHEIAKRIGRSEKSTRNRIYRLGLNFFGRKKTLVEWRDNEISILKNNTRTGLSKLKELLPRHTRDAIKIKKHKIGAIYKRVPTYTTDGYNVRYERRNGARKVIRIHREVIEKLIGRKLKSSEQVHHIDLDKKNNNPKNLYLCRDRKLHANLHYNIELVFAELFKRNIVRFNKEIGGYEICQSQKKRGLD